MIRSSSEELEEYELVKQPDHIATVWSVIEAMLPKYWEKFVERERNSSPVAKLQAKLGGKASTNQGSVEKEGAVVAKAFRQAIDDYEKDTEKYRQFFDPEYMDDLRGDPNAFKQNLSREVPVISRTLLQRQAALKDWQKLFRMTPPKDLLVVFTNVLEFRDDWSEEHDAKTYGSIDDAADFELDPLDVDEDLRIDGVIGMGIKSLVLYHLDPERFAARGRNGLYGLFFLSDKQTFDMPTKSSEFLMINDKEPSADGYMIIDQNYWYPYGVFTLYAIRVFRWIEERAKVAHFEIDRNLRYVYVERFFNAVCDEHEDDLKTMRAHERFEVPG